MFSHREEIFQPSIRNWFDDGLVFSEVCFRLRVMFSFSGRTLQIESSLYEWIDSPMVMSCFPEFPSFMDLLYC